MFMDARETTVDAPRGRVFDALARLGERRRASPLDWAWRMRETLDRKAVRTPFGQAPPPARRLGPGDALGCWRVERLDPGRSLALRALLRLPGEARLDYTVESLSEAPPRARLIQRSRFRPNGWLGRLYWWLLYPLHALVFRATLRAVAREATRENP